MDKSVSAIICKVGTIVGANVGGKLTGGGGNDTMTGGSQNDIITGTDSTAKGIDEYKYRSDLVTD
jgi:hypothetical protein